MNEKVKEYQGEPETLETSFVQMKVSKTQEGQLKKERNMTDKRNLTLKIIKKREKISLVPPVLC